MRFCNNCNKEYSEDMNYCEVCGQELHEDISKEARLEELNDDKFERFIDDMYSPENREVLKELIVWTGVEWLSKDKEFLKEIMIKFADFKAKKRNPPEDW